jgi:hypothetical protein
VENFSHEIFVRIILEILRESAVKYRAGNCNGHGAKEAEDDQVESASKKNGEAAMRLPVRLP